MYREQDGSHKQEREFQRLGNPGEKRSQGCGAHDPGHILFVLGLGFVIDRQCGRRQTEHHEREFTGHERTGRKVNAVTELRHEDLLVAANELARFVHVFSKLEPERRIKDMVQTERNERTLHNPENERRQRAVLLKHEMGRRV
ncbi:hypothetical protein D1872_251720 [compost metagenome]